MDTRDSEVTVMRHRSHFASAVVGGLVVAVAVTAVPVVAGVGDTLLLGRENKGGKETTELSANVADGPGLKVTNSAGDSKAAVRINTDGTAPPFATNSDRRVLNFNADKLDDLDAVDLGVLVAGDATTDVPDVTGDTTALSTDLDVPVSGHLVVQAIVDTYNDTFPDVMTCRLVVDGADVVGSKMNVRIDSSVVLDEVCATNGMRAVGPGSHTVDFALEAVDASTGLRDASLSVIFVPGEA